MKRLFLALCFIPSLVLAAPFDLLIQQQNIAGSAIFTRTTPLPAFNTPMIVGIDRNTNLPQVFTLDQPFDVQNGLLMVSLRWDQILNKPVFSPVSVSGDYNDLINKPASSTQVNPDWSASSGVAAILNKPTTLAGYGVTDAYPLSGNPSGFLTGVTGAQVASALGFTPYSSTNPSAFITQAGARSAITLTTTGTSGAATYNSATGALNVPSYAASRSQAAVTRSLNTAFQVSTTRDAWVSYSVQITVTSSITGGQNGDAILEMASDSGFTTNMQQLSIGGVGQTYTLAVALQGVQPQTTVLSGFVPAGYYVRVRTVNNAGAPSFLMRAGQEALM